MDTVQHPVIIKKNTLRIAVGALFFLAGLCFSSWAARIPTIQQSMGLSNTALGAILFALPVGLMCSLPLSGWAIHAKGSKKVLLAAIIAYGVVLVCLGLAKTPLQLVVCLFFYGLAGNAVNISVNTQAIAAEGFHSKPIMASFHGLWSFAGFVGAGVGALMISYHVAPLYHFIGILLVLIIGVAIASGSLYDDAEGSQNEVQPVLSLKQRLNLMIPLLKLGSIAFCSLICEGAMFDWSNIYFKEVVKVPPTLQGVGFTVFMSTMFIGRLFIGDSFAHRFGIKLTLQISGALTAAGLLLAVIFPNLYTVIAGFLLVGAGVSSVVPLVYSATGKSTTMSPGVALAAVSSIGFVGFLFGPPLIGFIAGLATLRASFLFVAAMGTCVVILSSRVKL